MRAGIHFGRPPAQSGRAREARSFVLFAIERLSTERHSHSSDDELVFYAGRSVLDRELLDRVALAPVLTTEATNLFYTPASRYFRRLPNGARCRVLLRRLPETRLPWLNGLLDRVLLLFWRFFDRLAVFHAASGVALLLPGIPQAVTVEPPQPRGDASRTSRGEQRWTRREIVFRYQMSGAEHCIVSGARAADSLARRFGRDPARITVIRPGLDEHFLAYRPPTPGEEKLQLQLGGERVSPGFIMVLASRVESELLEAVVESAGRNKRPVVLIADNAVDVLRQLGLGHGSIGERAAKTIRSLARSRPKGGAANGAKEGSTSEEVARVVNASAVAPRHLPTLLSRAGAVLLPNVDEENTLPLSQVMAVGGVAVTWPLRHSGTAKGRLFCAEQRSTTALLAALEEALETRHGLPHAALSPSFGAAIAEPRGGSHRREGAYNFAEFRTIRDVVRDTFAVYRTVVLRYKRIK